MSTSDDNKICFKVIQRTTQGQTKVFFKGHLIVLVFLIHGYGVYCNYFQTFSMRSSSKIIACSKTSMYRNRKKNKEKFHITMITYISLILYNYITAYWKSESVWSVHLTHKLIWYQTTWQARHFISKFKFVLIVCYQIL